MDEAVRLWVEKRVAEQTEAERNVVDERGKALSAKMAECVDQLALENFGIAKQFSDGISMAHPAVAGVVRRALRDAYGRGLVDTCVELMVGSEALKSLEAG